MDSPAVCDLESALELLASDPHTDLDDVVLVEQSTIFPGLLVFQPFDGDLQGFFTTYGIEDNWISRYLVLNEHFMFDPFTERLERDGKIVLFGPSTKSILADYDRWRAELAIEGFTCPHGKELRPYQTFCLQRAFERNKARKASGRLTMPGWCAGAGKSIFACAGAQELVNRGEIDLVLAFTMQRHKINLANFFRDTTTLKAVVPDGLKAKRQLTYTDESVDVFVLNYEKCRHDFHELYAITQKRRVLFVLDEVQMVLAAGAGNKARQGLDKLIKTSKATIWPMTASIVGPNPLRYRSVFSLSQTRDNPLGTKEDFEARYLQRDAFGNLKKRTYERHSAHGGTFYITDYDWDHTLLQEVRHRVANQVQQARKNDPGIREYFPPLQIIDVAIQMSEEDRLLYKAVQYLADRARKAGESVAPYYLLLRYVCNTPEALRYSNSPVAKLLVEEYPQLITSKNSAKLEYFLDQVESIADAGDKVIAFTHWTNMGLQILHRELEKRKISHTVHYGTGQSEKDSQKAQDDFKRDPNITLFLTSDAGAYCLNFQEARYCIQYEVPYSFDDYQQRINRIHRSDSHLTGLTAYNYVTEDSVEIRIAHICEQRRLLAEATLGTDETVSHEIDIPGLAAAAILDPELQSRIDRPEELNAEFMIFGNEGDNRA